jgi:hypothetical protein
VIESERVPSILIAVPDLMFGTRIEDSAKHLNIPLHSLAPGDDADTEIPRLAPTLVIVALDTPNWSKTIAAAKRAGVRVLAFGSHRDVETMKAARAAGADQVVARSAMASDLETLIKRYVHED